MALRNIAVLLVWFASLRAHAADPSVTYEKYKLDNGLTVILSEDHRLPQVAVNIWYHVGAADQVPGKSGFAHLFEHMMLSGAKHIGNDAFRVAEELGAPAGRQANGTTSFDRTNYFEVVPSDQLAGALWLESDRMAFMLETLDQKKLAIQRDVVSNERRQSYETQPYGLSRLKLCNAMYPAPHPYHHCVIGSIDEIQPASMDDLVAFFKRHYGPNNASIAIVGDFDKATAKELVQRYFGTIPKRESPERPTTETPKLTGVKREKLDERVARVPRVVLAWNGLKPYEAGDEVGDVLSQILAGGRASRLYRTLVFDKKVATDVSASNETAGLGGTISVSATANQGKTTEEMLTLIREVIAGVQSGGVTAEEVERAKRTLVASFLRSIERVGGFGGKADLLNDYEMWLGDPGYLPKHLARFRAVTPEAVKRFAHERMPLDRVYILDIVPIAETATPAGASR